MTIVDLPPDAADDNDEVALSVPDDTPPKMRPVQISSAAHDRISRVANETGFSRVQIIEHLIMRQNAREIVSILKADKVVRRPTGRRKQRYHT